MAIHMLNNTIYAKEDIQSYKTTKPHHQESCYELDWWTDTKMKHGIYIKTKFENFSSNRFSMYVISS